MKLLIVDDHPIVRDGLRRLLAARPEIALSEAATGEEALALCKSLRPQLVILDLNLPGIGGLELIGRLKAEDAALRVLVLSMHDNLVYVTRALQAGAQGYVSKQAPPEQILEAIARLARGQTYIEHRMAEELALQNIRPSAHPLHDLSRRELEILRLLGEGCSLPQIGTTLGVSYKTVANTCSQIKTKLGVARTADLIRIAVQNCVAPAR
ncbi:MAG TPA: response regulator transcription factor [Candidatus Sulfotelmatobacter sp.]|nr:response regulator transcription factor [Candidatus Sulfotelmatobacter sp.]